ncbi:protein kinase [Nannocystis sp. ILAH1]|uniref:protein kinase domain-containing protein n=1 Tax=Nannocystis sp. ILAH1 TaxID=2996789 RepID=UPI00227027F8|nr:protein kinase [Nannocystis sp. ILAH1]MCY0986551.1 protein kinase [Nannocystis sp. ILAH1]
MSRATPTWPVHKEIGADYLGEVIDDRYRIVERLAQGGMAHVFMAKDRTRKCYVALKILHRTGPESRRRFEVEAEVLSNVQHPHIVRPIAFGHTADAQPYMALEYLEGETWSQRLARGPLPWREVVELGAQIAGALHALHNLGVIHRDVKPDNIMIVAGGDRAVAKLIDLGLASVGTPFREAQDARFASQVPERHKTQLGPTIGTPPYLPPEAGLQAAEPRLDVYSLGATLYQLCTRTLPDRTDVRAIQAVRPDSEAPEDLSRLLRAALDPDVADRLPSADHLRRGLEAILAAHPPTPRSRHLFGGCYDRLELLGVGASAIVYRASDRELSREVALKVLRDAKPSDDDTLRFRRAAKILSALRHPNIPLIHHFGVEVSGPARDREQRFAVTELCSGSPASDFTRPDRHLRPDEVITVGRQLAGALAAVHAAGIVYRDLHVGNVLIARGEQPQAWIFDFDQAQVSPEFYARVTERWATPPEERVEPANEKPLQRMDYAAPEVRAGGAFTAASDVFALGLLLYRLLTGLRPFPPEGGAATPARKVCPGCAAGLDRLLLSMLSPSPNSRPTLAAVQTSLEDEQAELAAEQEEAAAAKTSTARGVDASPSAAVAQPAAATMALLHKFAPSADAVPLAAGAVLTANRAPRKHGRLVTGLLMALGLIGAWWSLRPEPVATQVTARPEQATAERRAEDPPLVHRDAEPSSANVQPITVPEQMPASPTPPASAVATASKPQETAAATRATRPHKPAPVATWEARMLKAETSARRCLDAAGIQPRPLLVTMAPDAAPQVRGVKFDSPQARCVREALERYRLHAPNGLRQHTFFAKQAP